MTLILALLTAFIPLLNGLVGANYTNLIQAALTAIGTLIATWGKNPTSDSSAALAALQGILTALKADTTLDPAVLAQIAEADRIVSAGIAGIQYVEATGWNPSTYTPPPPVA